MTRIAHSRVLLVQRELFISLFLCSVEPTRREENAVQTINMMRQRNAFNRYVVVATANERSSARLISYNYVSTYLLIRSAHIYWYDLHISALTKGMSLTISCSLVCSRLDFGSFVSADISDLEVNRFQRNQNDQHRLVLRTNSLILSQPVWS